MNVTKALIIGLGSTGTKICQLVAERIEWELRTLKRAPWVKFLCIETDGNNRPAYIPYEDFIPLTISASDYNSILTNTAEYDRRISLSTWADMGTLGRLRDQGIAQGAGNIRMVGRLAFLHPGNYEKVHGSVLSRATTLRQLSRAEVEEAFGTNPDGSKEEFSFANNGKTVIYVVGSLCGGTCSGLAADFGYFLNLDTYQDETKIAIFMLPHPNLTQDLVKTAERFKKNAYSALVELNQYYLSKRDQHTELKIRFPDGRDAPLSQAPYDYLFITTPREPVNDYYEQLNGAIADYIFLNVFVPSTLPMAKGVDAPEVLDRENQAHVFCTLGLSTLEFPAQRVIEACTYRLAGYALRTWCLHRSSDDQVQQWLDADGLTWEGIKERLFQVNGQNAAREVVDKFGNEARAKAWRLTQAAREEVARFRRQFTQPSDDDNSPERNLWQIAMSNRQEVANAIVSQLQNRIRQLLSYEYGPRVVEDLLHQVDSRLQTLEDAQVSLEDLGKSLDDLLNQLARTRVGWLWRIFKTSDTRRMILGIPNLLAQEADTRLDALVAEAVRDRVLPSGAKERGIASRIREHIRLYRQRASHLVHRLETLYNRLLRESDEMARKEPNVNGEVLFEPDYVGSGTVTTEFRRCLELHAGTTGTTWEEHREEMAKRVAGSLSALHGYLVLHPTAQPEQDWLKNPIRLDDPNDWLLSNLRNEMLERARQPFLRLRTENVIDRWFNASNREAKAQTAVQKANSFLDLNEVLATAGGRSPIVRRRLVLLPDSGNRDELLHIVHSGFGDPSVDVSPDPYRVVFVQEQFRFPLRGLPSVVGPNGIAHAKCMDFPIFFSRRDVPWLGLTDVESRQLREAEEIIVAGVLLEIIKPAQGALVFEVSRTGFGDTGQRRLPLSFIRASVMLARSENDLDGRSLGKAMETLSAKIRQKREEIQQQGSDEPFIRYLNDQLVRGIGKEVPDCSEQWLAERLERHCASDPNLLRAFDKVFPPDESIRNNLKKRKGDLLANGRTCEQEGYYCSMCGGLIGYTEQEAAVSGWRCFVNPDHYFGHYGN